MVVMSLRVKTAVLTPRDVVTFMQDIAELAVQTLAEHAGAKS